MKMRRRAQQVRLRFALGNDRADGGAASCVDRCDAALEPVGGGFNLALVKQKRAKIDRSLSIVGRDRQRFAKAALGFLHVAARLLRIAEIVKDFGRRSFVRSFGEKMNSGFVISTVETFESCQGFVGWGHGSSAIAGSDRP